MKSKTKNLLSEDQIKKLVKVNFGDNCEVGSITSLKGGMFNSAYLIERINEKDKIVLKVSIAPGTKTLTYEKDPMPTEVAVYQMVAEKTTIPTPRILAYDLSKKQLPSNYFFMTALEGVTMYKVMKKLSPENMAKLKAELAGYFAQLHQIKGTYYGYFTEDVGSRYSTWREGFLHMMDMLLADGKAHKIKLPYERYEKMLAEKAVYLEDIKEPALVDYDLWPGNIFVKEVNGEYVIEGIIDFERAFWGDPMADFPPALMFQKNIRQDPQFWNTYCEKADHNQELTNEDDIRQKLYSLYIWTIMTLETFRYDFLYGRLQQAFSRKNALKYLKELEQS